MYATRAHMVAAFGEDELIQLTDRPGLGEIDDGVLNAALDAASAEIDGYVGRVATLPLAEAPVVLTNLALAIARYRLSTDQPDGRVRVDYEDAVAVLDKIAKGIILLTPPAVQTEPRLARVRGSAAPLVFGARLGSNWP